LLNFHTANKNFQITFQCKPTFKIKNLNHIFQPITSNMDYDNVFLASPCIMIGPFLLEFNEYGLCIPRKNTQKGNILPKHSMKFEFMKDSNFNENLLKKISNLIIFYNSCK